MPISVAASRTASKVPIRLIAITFLNASRSWAESNSPSLPIVRRDRLGPADDRQGRRVRLRPRPRRVQEGDRDQPDRHLRRGPAGRHAGEVDDRAPLTGLIDTPIYGEGEASEAFKAKLGESVLFPKRLGEPEELASMVIECVRNTYMNGETIRVDGGIRMPPK